MVSSLGVSDITIDDFSKIYDEGALKKRNFSEYQKELLRLKEYCAESGLMGFGEQCDVLFEGIDRHLTVDGGIIVELLLDYLCNEGYGDDEDAKESERRKVEQVIYDSFCIVFGWGRSNCFKKIANVDFSFIWIVKVCEKRKKDKKGGSSIQVFDQIVLVNMGKIVGIAKKGETKGLVTKMSNMGIMGITTN